MVVNGAGCDGVQLNTTDMRVKVKVDAFITLEPRVHRFWAPGLPPHPGRLNFCTMSDICGSSFVDLPSCHPSGA